MAPGERVGVHLPPKPEVSMTMHQLLYLSRADVASVALDMPTIINLLEIARGNSCKFLQLDCDGVEYDDLPTFSW
jgi:hypothetical protein